MLAAALADDTTGALEIGALLAKFQARILLQSDSPPAGCDVAVFDTQTRHLPPAEAEASLFRYAKRLREAHTLWIYKKTDSTLRGPIGAEFDGLLEAFPERSLVYAPAYPRLGRTLADGILRIHGTPVAETDFARDPLNPVTGSSVPALIAATCRRASRVTIHDAEDEFEMEQIAESVWPAEEIAAGPAGFAGHWSRLLPLPATPPQKFPRIMTPVVVCGSLHPMSRCQAEAAHQLGVRVILSPAQPAGDAQQIAQEMAQCAAKAVRDHHADSLIVMGGDTARAAFQALGCRELTSAGEVAPGVPLSFTESGLSVITKAGGFGEPDLVHGILNRLT
ncbi:MAG: four-carbon acid sugar kinase family protein [Bryobacterales bacterium]|nr:four-carbon acid sugar kinase family protein [Bryobacterales bacterium]